MNHRARVVAAVERHLARRCPPGFWPACELYKHVVMAGSSLACLACGAEGKTGVLPRDVSAYNGAVETFLQEHRTCADREKARP